MVAGNAGDDLKLASAVGFEVEITHVRLAARKLESLPGKAEQLPPLAQFADFNVTRETGYHDILTERPELVTRALASTKDAEAAINAMQRMLGSLQANGSSVYYRGRDGQHQRLGLSLPSYVDLVNRSGVLSRLRHSLQSDVSRTAPSPCFVLQGTVQLPLTHVRAWMQALYLRADPIGSALGCAVPGSTERRHRRYCAFLATNVSHRINVACAHHSEAYCGLLQLVTHVARVASADSKVLHAKYAFTRAAPDLPLLIRTHLGEMVAHVVGGEKRLLGEKLVTHLASVMGQHGLQKRLYPYPIRPYTNTLEHVEGLVRADVAAQQRGGSSGGSGGGDVLAEPAGREDVLRWAHEHADALRERHDSWLSEEESKGHLTVTLSHNLTVRRWAAALLDGIDLLSDRDSPQSGSTPLPVFKSMGSWPMRPPGVVHMEMRSPYFTSLWNATSKSRSTRCIDNAREAANVMRSFASVLWSVRPMT